MNKKHFMILIVDDEPGIREGLKKVLGLEGYSIITADTGESAVKKMEEGGIDLAFVDLKLPDIDGCEVARRMFSRGLSETVIVIMTAFATVETAVNAMKIGVADYMKKPFDNEDIISIANRFFQKKNYSNSESEQPIEHDNNFLFINKNMKNLISIIEKVKDSSIPVLILGESGTGKEILARMIHTKGKPADSPFIGINCSAIPAHLMESELFGYEKGAFSDAVASKPGKFEIAEEGTLFMDEIGDMKFNLQSKLLRVLEEKNYERIGGIKPLPFNARLIASTNRNLRKMIAENKFRLDLYFRLKGIELIIPPLRERKDEIEPFVHYFAKLFSNTYNKKNISISSEALKHLKNYHWPGNIRELKNSVESAIVLAENDTLLLPKDFRIEVQFDKEPMLLEKEREYILQALEKNHFSRTLAAQELKISRKTLYNKMKKYLIE